MNQFDIHPGGIADSPIWAADAARTGQLARLAVTTIDSRPTHRLHSAVALLGGALALMGLVAACGPGASPLASDGDVPAAKRIKSNGAAAQTTNTAAGTQYLSDRTVTGLFGPAGGTFYVADDADTRQKKDDLRVSLTIAAGVLDADTPITMTVEGVDLYTLRISLDPHGLVFSTPVDMRIDLGNDLAPNSDLNKIVPYHLYDDGTVEDVDVYHLDRSSHTANIYLKVPGFSLYGLRD